MDFEILSAEQLEEAAVWRKSHANVSARAPEVREPELHKLIISDLIDVQVRDVVTSSAARSRRQACKRPTMCASRSGR